jgi:ankyrin repeat protein
MPSGKHPSVRTLRDQPDLLQLKRQAKVLLKAFAAGDADAVAEVNAHYHGARAEVFALHDAQLVLARSYGFASWPRLKAYVDGVTVRRLADAVRAGDLAAARSMVEARPELINLCVAEDDEHRSLHYAVLERRPEMVRFLMQHGADPGVGIWPHRDATTALTLATERGYAEIVAIIRDEGKRRGSSPLAALRAEEAGLDRTASWAILTGDANWLRARHAEGALANQRGLIGYAVSSDRPEMLQLLLGLGLDPDEPENLAGVDEVVLTWGAPLRECASSGKLALAEILLEHGANPNTNVYAASSALSEAYGRRDGAMIALLEQHGARLTAAFVGELGLTEQAARLLADDAAGRTPEGLTWPGSSVAHDLLWGAVGSSSPEIVRMALDRIPFARDDAHWHYILQNGLYLGPESNRPAHLEGFRLVLDRSDPNVRSKQGTTLLHDVAASRGGLTASDRLTFAQLLLDAGARLDLRDHLLKSTPLAWASRWGRIELVTLFLERGADPIEPDAEPWATPMAWAEKMNRSDVLAALRAHAQRQP